MEIVVGKTYSTRGGDKAAVSGEHGVAPDGTAPTYRFSGWVLSDGHWQAVTWTSEGMVFANHYEEESDLIAEWVEPVSLTAELVLVKTSRGGVGIYPVNAMYASDTVVARKTITLTEGEGV